MTIKFKITKASDYNYEDPKTFNSLEEFMAVAEQEDSIIIHYEAKEIVIYDDYIE